MRKYNTDLILCVVDFEEHRWVESEQGLVCGDCGIPKELKGYDPEESKFAKLYEDAGYIVDNGFPWCDDHCSQTMLNPNNELECVVCTGNEIAFVLMEE